MSANISGSSSTGEASSELNIWDPHSAQAASGQS